MAWLDFVFAILSVHTCFVRYLSYISSKEHFEGILGFSVPSVILADLLGNTCLFARVQKVMVCDSGLVDFDLFCLFCV